jgi:aryl-alcohol dehydrogenase-like predicted oxidoreductase
MAEGYRIALGTAQLGQRYGITNQSGPPADSEVLAMMDVMRGAGCDTLDTAMSYGDSEGVLGALGVRDFRVITKLPPLPLEPAGTRAWVREKVQRSLDRLRVTTLHGLLLHRPSDASGARANDLLDALASLKSEGVVEKIGVSVYEPDELAKVEGALKLDIVQAPYNVLDRRFADSGWFDRLRAAGTEIHVRSVFLQGLLLLEEARLPSAFLHWRPLWRRWCEWAGQQGIDNLTAALGFVLKNRNIARVVIGAETAAQLRQIVASAAALKNDVPAEIATNDLNLINPVNWTNK